MDTCVVHDLRLWLEARCYRKAEPGKLKGKICPVLALSQHCRVEPKALGQDLLIHH